jgi:hypothetical protein
MGTAGNAHNAIDIIIAENERDPPFKPLAVRRGFKENENVVTLLMGWGVLSAKNWKADVWGPNMNYPQIIKDIYNQQDPFFGTIAVLSPPIANFVKDAGYDTVEKSTEWVQPAPEDEEVAWEVVRLPSLSPVDPTTTTGAWAEWCPPGQSRLTSGGRCSLPWALGSFGGFFLFPPGNQL